MAEQDSKRFYWLKLNKDFFHQHKMKVLKAQPNGRLYALIYMELLAESTSHEGELRFSELIPYDVPTLAAVIDEDPDNVRCAIDTLTKMEMVEILDDQTIFMTDISKMIGSETGAAKRQREYRKQISCDNVTEMSPKCHLEYRDKSKENRDKNKYKYGEYSNVSLTDDERSKLDNEFGVEKVDKAIKFLDEYIQEKGYKSKSHYLAIRRWVFNAIDKGMSNYTYQPKHEAIPTYNANNNASFGETSYEDLMRNKNV